MFFWLEVVFLVLYIFEFIFRIYQHRKWLTLENEEIEKEDKVTRASARPTLHRGASSIIFPKKKSSVENIRRTLVQLASETKHAAISFADMLDFFKTVRGVFMLIDLFTIIVGLISVCQLGPS